MPDDEVSPFLCRIKLKRFLDSSCIFTVARKTCTRRSVLVPYRMSKESLAIRIGLSQTRTRRSGYDTLFAITYSMRISFRYLWPKLNVPSPCLTNVGILTLHCSPHMSYQLKKRNIERCFRFHSMLPIRHPADSHSRLKIMQWPLHFIQKSLLWDFSKYSM